MQIHKITIRNFRSIESAEITASNFNILVGQNNHGKTNFFEAISWFYSGKSSKDIKYGQDDSREISVEIEFKDAQSGIEKMPDGASKTKIINVLGEYENFSVKKSSLDDKRVFIVNGEEKSNPAGFDTALNQFLPKLEYIDTKIRLSDVSKFKSKTPISEMLSGVLTTIIQTSPTYQAFEEKFEELFNQDDSEVRIQLNALGDKVQFFLQKQFPEGTLVKFNVETPVFDDLLKNFETEVNDGIVTTAEEKGDGMQRAIMLAIIQAYAVFRKEREINKTFLFLIDEAELHLHPSGQRSLKNALLDIASEGDQVFINTHSSVLVADENEVQSIFKVEKKEMKTSILQMDENQKLNVIYDLLGGSPNDLLLPKNFLIVEGQAELEFLEILRSRFYRHAWRGMKIIFARGDIDMQKEIFHCIHRAFLPLMSTGVYKERTVIMCDKPNAENQSRYDDFKQSHPWMLEGEQLHTLPEAALEMYYPDGFKKTDSETVELASIPKGKVNYAREVASAISQSQFENGMLIVFQAVQKCIEKSYQ